MTDPVRPAPDPVAPRRIIVVDDDRAMRASVRDLLEAYRWTVQSPPPGAQRLREGLSDVPASLKQSDMRMPKISDYDLLDDPQGRPDFPPVVLITGRADITSAITAIRRGAFDFLEKPYGPEWLPILIDNAAALHSAWRGGTRPG